MRSKFLTTACVVLCLGGLAACSGDGGSSGNGDTTAPVESTVATTVVTDELVDADNVLLAVALLEAGDVDAALAAGLVNPAEVEAATEAVDDGSVDQWAERADGR